MSYDSNVTSCLHPKLLSRLKDFGIARNVPKTPRKSKKGGRRKQRKISVIVGIHEPIPAGSALPSLHLHSVLCRLEEPSAPAVPITPDETNSAASNTLLACSHLQKGNVIWKETRQAFSMHSQLESEIHALKLLIVCVLW